MPGSIWVLAECWRGKLSDITYELLALGRELADAAGVPLAAVLFGKRELAATLGKADRVLHADLADPLPEAAAEALAGLAEQQQPLALLIPLTNVSMGIGTLVAARLGTAAVNFCKDATVVDGRVQAHCVLYGGKIAADVAPAVGPAILGVWPGTRPGDAGRAAAAPPVEDVSVMVTEIPQIRFKGYVEPVAGDVDLTTQEALVAVGRGIQSQDNVELAQALADALGGAVCGSRPVIDQGWLPLSRQVGKSGMTVKPKVYIAAGVSGAPEHTEGMKDAELIIAINSDPGAPIFSVAHFGVVADALDVLPALTEAIAARKG
jgi:electron transfer flavoprotein alpha subunit